MDQNKDQRTQPLVAKRPTVLFGKHYWWVRAQDGQLSLIPDPIR